MERIRPFIGSDLIKVMTGIRRAGKSVMLELIQAELLESGVSSNQFITINFEDMRYANLLNAADLHTEILRRADTIQGKAYLFFDEIQEVQGWEKCVNSLRVALDCDIYITGSNAKLLSGELATYLGGRYVEFVIYPFSFAEFINLCRRAFQTISFRPVQLRPTQRYCEAQRNQGCGFAGKNHRLCYGEYRHNLFCVLTCEVFQK